MTTALYRRYRPDTFQDVIGQDHVTAPLMAALRADRVTHAYLFSGPRGCGKTTSARILARCLNCENYPTDTPCGECPSCRDLATGGPGSLDVVEIDAASHNGVDDARDLRERASFAPARDRFKIFILDEAHMVTPQGFNALLKLVEEPPAHVKFIFATTEPEKVIGTIRSRTHHYPFRLVPPDVLEAYLAHLCEAERVQVGPGVFPLVTRAGGGSVRDTLSVMDQLIGGAVDGEVDYHRAVALLGYTDTAMLDQCVDAIAASDGAGVFRVVDRVISSGHDPRRFVEDLLQRLRDLLVIALAGSEAGPALGSLPADELSRMESQAQTLGALGLSRAADLTAQALGQMVGATSPRLQLELLMARLLVPAERPADAAAPAAAPRGQAAPVPAPSGSGAGRARAAEIARQAAAAAVQPAPQVPSQCDAAASWSQPVAPAQGAAPEGAAERPVSVDWGDPAVPGAAASPAAQPAGPAPHAASPARSAGPSGAPGPVASAGSEAAHSGSDAAAPARGSSSAGPAPAGAAPRDASHEPTARAAQVSPAPSGAPSSAPGEGGTAAEAEMIRDRWEEVLDAARRSRRATWALVGPNSQPGTIRGTVFEVIFTSQGLVNAFENGGHGPILGEAVHQALGLTLEVHAVLAGPGGHGGGPGGGGSGPAPAGPMPTGGARTGRPASAPAHAPAQSAPAAPAHGSGAQGGARRDAAPRGESAAAGSSTHHAAPPPRMVGDDGWGEVAIPGGARSAPVAPPDEHAPQVGAADESPQPSAPSPAPIATASTAFHAGGADVAPPADASASSPGTGASVGSSAASPADSCFVPNDPEPQSPSAPSPEVPSAASPAQAEQEDGPGSGEAASQAGTGFAAGPAGYGSPAGPAGTAGPARSANLAGPATPASPARSASPAAASGSTPEDDAPLATVHRLRALPPLPPAAGPASGAGSAGHQAPAHGLAPVAWDAGPSAPVPWGESGGSTFSDGVPIPEEPGDPDGPGDSWAPSGRGGSGSSGSGVSAAMAAARAAASGHAPSRAGAEAHTGIADAAFDAPSEDDEDAEEAGVVGLEVVKKLLGATVIEEITLTEEGL